MIANYWRGVGLALSTALLWGASAPIMKMIAASGLTPLSVMVYRCIFISLVLGTWLCAKRGAGVFLPPARTLKIYTALGFLTIVCMGCGFLASCVYLTVPQAVILHYTFPLLTLAGDTWITGERPRPVQLLSALMIFTGVYIGFDVGGQGLADISIAGLAWGVLSVLGFTGQNLLVRAVSKGGKADPLAQVFFVHLLGGTMLLLGKSALMGWDDLAGVTPGIFGLMQYHAIACGLIAFIFLFASLKYISATATSLICSLEIVGALTLSPILLGGGSSAKELVGSAIILAAVICSTLGKRSG